MNLKPNQIYETDRENLRAQFYFGRMFGLAARRSVYRENDLIYNRERYAVRVGGMEQKKIKKGANCMATQ